MLPRIYEKSPAELVQWCQEQGLPTYRAGQIQQQIFPNRATQFGEMTNLPAKLREQLAAAFTLFPSEVVAHQIAKDRTEKLLLQLHDGSLVECVLMREDDRRTICISTQVGCGMGCVFCASGLLGLKRNLTTGEILEQVLRLDRLLPADEKLTNVVVMGMGEPLANLKNLLPALDRLTADDGLGLGARRITVSTVGLPEKIRELAQTGHQFNLAVSLHAPEAELRTKLVPVNRNIGIEAVLEAADDYFAVTGRRVSYEYVLLGGINDLPEHARQLGHLLKSRIAHVNLIPMNGVKELPFAEPSAPQTGEFVTILESFGVPVTVRKRKGADIDAACGQLRMKREQQNLVVL
ncbi:putative dual-specificity RNA methyltransferase RlmN [Planctopirus ephydatiae]|uniref:Probable dual-specificity RNA methyltransferase RlmN n=1 Tax=Planctopirus ephydatiae TaxID=2528019 RepID=A0A518GSP0_9PLAN|nr:23S rRNA (adenine(2503)-C(2))-methyltransferase RlmN [Planctopirus ephydatiae]QDV31602.1 putative dual-specificity RNA methyltransferase RlmN [Planctopirus ephydatiae]